MPIPPDYRELHAAFSRGPAAVRAAIHDLTLSELARRSDGAGWSVRDVLVHLADMELVRAFRIRLILVEDRPLLPNTDEAAWQRKLQYLWRSPEAAISQFEQLRFGTAEILEHIGKEAWTRTGQHPEDGDLSVVELVRRGVAHVEDHARQVAAIRGRKAPG